MAGKLLMASNENPWNARIVGWITRKGLSDAN
jgi:hypothetical protein